MLAISIEKLDKIIERFAQQNMRLSSGATGEAFVRLVKEYAELEPSAKKARSLKAAYMEAHGLAEMLAGGGEFAQLAEPKNLLLLHVSPRLEQEMRILLAAEGCSRRTQCHSGSASRDRW